MGKIKNIPKPVKTGIIVGCAVALSVVLNGYGICAIMFGITFGLVSGIMASDKF